MTRARYVAMLWDWPLQIPCPFCVRDTETGECVLFPDTLGTLRPNMRTMEAAEKRAARLNRALANFDKAQSALPRGNRWGESRRFMGRAAGIRLDRLDRARERWLRLAHPAERAA